MPPRENKPSESPSPLGFDHFRTCSLPSLEAKVEACFRKQSMEFDRWRPAQVLRDRILESPDKLPDKVCNAMAKMFNTINTVFSVHTS